VAAVDALLARGVEVDARDKDGFTALHRVSVTGNVAMVAHLLRKGAAVNAEDAYGDTPLHYACFCNHLDAAKALVAAGGDPARPSRDGKTPLASALEEGHTALVSALGAYVHALVPAPAGKPPATAARPGAAGALTPTPPSAPRPGGGGGAAGGAAAAAAAASSPGFTAPAAPAMPRAPSLPPPSFTPATTVPIATSLFLGGPPGGAGHSVNGLDFSRGVVIEGELGKKRKNKLMKWRPKYYVLSRVFGALFFWNGTRTHVGASFVAAPTAVSLRACARPTLHPHTHRRPRQHEEGAV